VRERKKKERKIEWEKEMNKKRNETEREREWVSVRETEIVGEWINKEVWERGRVGKKIKGPFI